MLNLFIEFFLIGLFTIGGGYAMIPLINQRVIENGWMTLDKLISFIGISESTPGPFAINIATFVGIENNGLLGAVLATFGVVLPSFIIILIIAKYFDKYRKNKFVDAAFIGLRPTVIGLIASSVFLIAQATFVGGGYFDFKGLIIIGILAVIQFKIYKKLHPIALIGISALLGIIFYGLLI